MTPARLVVTRDAPDDVGERQIILLVGAPLLYCASRAYERTAA
jgi:hypothetical protein